MRMIGVGLLITSAIMMGFNTSRCMGGVEPGRVVKERLPGSRITLNEAVRKARLVVIAVYKDVGKPQLGSLGHTAYGDGRLWVVKFLKGKVATQDLSPIQFVVNTYPLESAEEAPDQNMVYLVFLKGPTLDPLNAIKALRATKENIHATKKALKAAEERLPGSQVSIQEAARKARLVVVAEDVDLGGMGQSGFVALDEYGKAKLRVVQSLKGETPAKELSPIRVTIRTKPPEVAETTPDQAKTYLFFLEGPGLDALKTVKVLRATKENIHATKKALEEVGP